jgi:hypothetical protein
MDDKENDKTKKSDPDKAYRDEWKDRGKELFDTEREGDARDLAKVEKATTGHGQKIDGVHPSELEE